MTCATAVLQRQTGTLIRKQTAMDETRIGCSTSGDELLAIGQALRDAVSGDLVERERTPDGLRLRISRHPGAMTAIREYVRPEQACCSFFGFTITQDRETLSLTMAGPPEAAPLIDLLYQLAAPAAPAAPAASTRWLRSCRSDPAS